jgi:para-nitrobenzyl esterase
LLRAIEGDLRFRIPGLRFAEAHVGAGGHAYAYLFRYASPGLRGALGACHALELPFVFGSLHTPDQERFAGRGPEVEALSRAMMGAWIAFARTGDPSTPELGAWPRFEPRERATMVFDRASALESAPLDAERALWDEILP